MGVEGWNERNEPPKVIRVLLADTEPQALALATHALTGDRRIAVVRTCRDGLEAYRSLEEGGIDVALVDVELPSIDGFDLIRRHCRDRASAEIIFVSSATQHALDAFDAGVVDFVAKPFSSERLRRAVLRAACRRRERRLSALREARDWLVVKPRTGTPFIEYDDIEAVDADEKEVWLRVHGRRVRYASTMAAIDARLPSPPFLRVHRSHIVNLDHVRDWTHAPNGTAMVRLRSGGEVPVSRRAKRRITGG